MLNNVVWNHEGVCNWYHWFLGKLFLMLLYLFLFVCFLHLQTWLTNFFILIYGTDNEHVTFPYNQLAMSFYPLPCVLYVFLLVLITVLNLSTCCFICTLMPFILWHPCLECENHLHNSICSFTLNVYIDYLIKDEHFLNFKQQHQNSHFSFEMF